jgi:four helix bundle protein
MPNKYESFEELPVWRRARELTGLVYARSKSGEFARDFALRDRIRRASISIVASISEGYERGSNRELTQSLSYAKGSCGEVRAQLHLARDQGYLDENAHTELVEECTELAKMLGGWMRHLKQSASQTKN